MDEQRLEAYLNLIQQLVNCPSGEELDILNANREFVDMGLVLVMEQVAERMAAQGEGNAGWLQNLAVAITKMLEDSSSSTTLEDYLSFLQELLQAEWESNGDSQRVNQVLQRNLDKLDENFARIFPQVATDFIAKHPEEAELTVALVENISIRKNQGRSGAKHRTSRTLPQCLTSADLRSLSGGLGKDSEQSSSSLLLQNPRR